MVRTRKEKHYIDICQSMLIYCYRLNTLVSMAAQNSDGDVHMKSNTGNTKR
jgi:hypothetical protein